MSAPTSLTVQTVAVGEPKVDGQYIVILKPNCDKTQFLATLRDRLHPESHVIHDYNANLLNCFAVKLKEHELAALRQEGGVESIHEDAITTLESLNAEDNTTLPDIATVDNLDGTITETNAPWGLQRINQPDKLSGSPGTLGYTFTFDVRAGRGVDIYIIDSGIRITHKDFGGRAKFGYSAIPGQTEDGRGHGTHVAGTAGGTVLGVAKQATLIAVKIIDDEGHMKTSDTLAGLNWTFVQATTSDRPSVINLSWGRPATDITPVDRAVSNMIAAGIHAVVAAGNRDWDAKKTSPAHLLEANTIGSMSIKDVRASSSNWGAVLDVFAPGVHIISASNKSDDGLAVKSGTSMAAPHAAGTAAYLLSILGQMTPELLQVLIRDKLAVRDKLGDVPSGTRNYLLQCPKKI